MQWVLRLTALWKHRDDKNKVIYILSTMLFFAIASLAWTNYQKGVTEKKLQLSEQSLRTAEQVIERRTREQMINETLRIELDNLLQVRERELQRVKEELSGEIADINKEYQELLKQAQRNESEEYNGIANSEESCYVQVEGLARRAAVSANERMWYFYNHRVPN